MSTQVCPSGREIKAKHQTVHDGEAAAHSSAASGRGRSLRRCSKFTPQFPKSGSRPSRTTGLPTVSSGCGPCFQCPPKLERSQGDLRPGQGGLRLLTAKFSGPPPGARRPRPSSRWPPSSPRPAGAEGGSEARTQGRQTSAGIAPSPSRRAVGPATRAAPSQRRPRHVRPLASRPPRPETPRPAAGLRSAGPPGR